MATGGGGAGHLGGLPRGARELGMPASILPALDVRPARVRGEGCERGPQATRRGREHGKEPGGKAIFTASDLGQLWADTVQSALRTAPFCRIFKTISEKLRVQDLFYNSGILMALKNLKFL